MSDFLNFAVGLVVRGGQILAEFIGRRPAPDWESRHHFKTEADDAVDRILVEMIQECLPDHAILSEESGRLGQDSEFLWVCDAVDGTFALSTGVNTEFAVSVSLCRDLVPVVGVILAPARGELYYAELGGGAFCNGRPIRVASEMELTRAILDISSGKFGRALHVPFLTKAFGDNGVTQVLNAVRRPWPWPMSLTAGTTLASV